MNQQRRKRLSAGAAKVIVALFVLDAAVYFGLNRTLANLVVDTQAQFTAVRLNWLRERAKLSGLEAGAAALPGEQQQAKLFFDEHIPPRRVAFSRAATLIEKLTQRSHVDLTAIKYTPEADQAEPVSHLNLDAGVRGSFDNLLDFAHGLETADDFIVVRSFKFAAEDGGVLALHVNADLYLTP